MTQEDDRPIILIVDDEPVSRMLTDSALKEDFRLVITADGTEALAAVQRHDIDLALLDINMPGIDGYEVCRRFKADEKTQDIPVIFLSVLDAHEDEAKGFDLGAVDYVSKPANPALLRARVWTHIKLYQAQQALAHHSELLEQQLSAKTQKLLQAQEAEFRQGQGVAQLATELETLFQLAPFGIARLHKRKFVKINEAFNQMLGYHGNELIGYTTREIYHSDQQYEEIGKSAYEPLQRGEHVKFETRLRTKDDQTIWVLAGTCAINPNDPQSDALYIIQDISDHRVLEDRLAAAAERANALSLAKSEFLSVISHELRTPLNGILGMAQLLELMVGESELEFVRSIRQSGEGLLAIVNQIVAYTAIDARSLAASLEMINVFVLIALRADRYMVKAQQKGLAFELQIDETFQEEMEIDAKSLENLLDILLDNAMKFTDTGSIRLIAALEHGASKSGCLVCTIQDSGIGMSPETLQTLYTPFHQGESVITRKHQGVGLGLALAKKLIERLGGTITVESQLGHGSKVQLRIPLGIASL